MSDTIVFLGILLLFLSPMGLIGYCSYQDANSPDQLKADSLNQLRIEEACSILPSLTVSQLKRVDKNLFISCVSVGK